MITKVVHNFPYMKLLVNSYNFVFSNWVGRSTLQKAFYVIRKLSVYYFRCTYIKSTDSDLLLECGLL